MAQHQPKKRQPATLVKLHVLPDTPNTRRLAQVCHQVWQRTHAQKAA